MNINRTNYENFFLLYVDGELSASEMQAVDSFAAENGDLQAELEILLDTKLSADSATLFTDKHLLYRSSENTINEFNYEEKFLLFIDNELTEEEKEQTKQFIALHPELDNSLELLKQTILPAENIVFANKELLYRNEADRKPILIGWRRMAVAAAMIGLIFMVWNLLPKTDRLNVTVKNKPIQPVINKGAASDNGVIENGTSIENNVAEKSIAVVNQSKSTPISSAVNKTVLPNSDNNSNNRQQESVQAMTVENDALAMNEAPKSIVDSDHYNQITKSAYTSTTEIEQPVFHQTVLKELDTDDENKSLYVAGLELNKDKLRGIFRKASNIFKSKASKEEDERYEASTPTRTLK